MSYEIITGDCLDWMREREAGSVDAVVTDPPYCSGGRQQSGSRNQITKSGRSDEQWFLGDNMGTDSYIWLMRSLAAEAIRICTIGSMAFVFTDWRQYSTVATAWETTGWTLRSAFVWDKAKGGAMGQYWRNNHEWGAIFTKGKPRPLASRDCFNTWTGTKPQSGNHPTEKPLDLMRYICSFVTPAGARILDPFCGSGTTGVAAILEGHSFVGIDFNPEYADIARERCEKAERQPDMFVRQPKPEQLEI